ncbi:hypothetical protein HNV11_23730 (plasmid) [Spirosoma taeanense]|uniref:Outer membrane efflux protein n=1 Tax=Spirosoma taeanense TaxID=2735870 RepID=A0A6M5YEP6_9BACT|nr:hypothetical protein [Spirosoma taeanense]QJW92485.1 hypothetical protein HNV11_23730 [Spirosoma taeanense]
MFTPRTPRSKIALAALFIALIVTIPGKAQEIKLKPLADYENSLKQYYTARLQADRLEFAEKTQKKWWYYLPTFGYAFRGPTVNVNTGLFAEIDKDNQTKKAQFSAITAQTELAYREELHQLRTQYRIMEVQREAITDIYVVEKIENRIYSVAEEANQQKQITPVEHSKALLLYQTQLLAHDTERRLFAQKIIELERLARFNYPTDLLENQTEWAQHPKPKL